MTVTINGKPRELPTATTLATLLDEMGVRAEGIAVAVNLEFVPRRAYAETRLDENDRVEIVSPHQGG